MSDTKQYKNSQNFGKSLIFATICSKKIDLI